MVCERGKLGSSSSSSSLHSSTTHDDHGSNKSSRNRLKMFAKRNIGLKKKIFEFSTLCGIDACLIVNGPNGELETWPENRIEVERIVQRYKNMNVEDREKRKGDLSSFIKDKKKKLETKIDQIRNESKSLYPVWNNKLDELPVDSLRELLFSLESKLEKVRARVEMKKQMIMNRGDVVDFSAMGDLNQDSPLNLPVLMINPDQPQPLDTYIPNSLVPQTHELFNFNSSLHHHQQQQNHNFLPSGGSMLSMYNSGFAMAEMAEMAENHHLHQYNLMGDHDDNENPNNFVSLPPLPPNYITIYSHQPQPLQACVPPSFQIEDDYFLNNIYSPHHQQQQQLDFEFMPINGGNTF